MSERLLTARELAELLGLQPGTVLDWFERGDLPGFRLRGRKGAPLRFRWSEIEATMETWRPADAPGREAPATRTGNARHGEAYGLELVSPATAPPEALDEKE